MSQKEPQGLWAYPELKTKSVFKQSWKEKVGLVPPQDSLERHGEGFPRKTCGCTLV
jgi:hypothetical protein